MCLLRGTDWVFKYNWLIFITEECVYCAVRTGSLNIIDWLVFITETESVYCAVRTGSLNIIDWLVFITETESVYCAVRIWSLNQTVTVSSLMG